MKQIIMFFVVAVFLSSCAYQTKMNVLALDSQRDIDGEKAVLNPYPGNNIQFTDSLIVIDCFLRESGVAISLFNRGTSFVKVVWDECGIIQPDNQFYKIAHSGIKYINAGNSQVPSVMPPKTRLDDVIIPIDNINYNENWEVKPIFGNCFSYDKRSTIDCANRYVGSKFSVILSLVIGDKPIFYTLNYKLENYRLMGIDANKRWKYID